MLRFLIAAVFAAVCSISYAQSLPTPNVAGLKVNGTTQNFPASGMIGNLSHLADNAALKAASTATYPDGVWRDSFSASAPAPALFYSASASACSLNSGAGDNGSQVQSSNGKCWLANFGGGGADVREFGAVADGLTDDTSAINAALAVETSVYLPSGSWHVTDMLQCRGGASFYGDGGESSVITVGAPTNDFNMSALGVVQAGTVGSQPGCTVSNLGISFYQVNTPGMTVANIVQYPVGITADNIHEANFLGFIRITNAWKCISITGASYATGGTEIGRVNCSDYGGGLTIDNATAGIHVNSWDEETFGLTPNQGAVFQSQGAAGVTAMQIGRCDGCAIDDLTTFTHGLSFPSGVTTTAAGTNIGELQLDGNGANLVNASPNPVRVGTFYGTGFANGGKIQQTGTGRTVIGSLSLQDGATGCDISVSAGTLSIGGGIYAVGSTSAANVCVTGGVLYGDNINYSTPASNRTAPVILQTSGIIDLVGNTTSGPGASTGNFLEVDVDNAANYVSGNFFGGWGINLNFTTAAGFYNIPDTPFTATVTPKFATEGDFSPVMGAQSNYYYRLGNMVQFVLNTTFSTNAYTTASGIFSVGINAPAQSGGGNPGCYLGLINNVTTSGKQVAAFMSGAVIGFALFGSAAAAQNFSTAQIPASASNILLEGQCTYRVR